MVWEKNIYAIVMLTKCVEQGRVSIFHLNDQVNSFLLWWKGILKSICLFKETLPQTLAPLFLETCFLSFSPLKVKKSFKKSILSFPYFVDKYQCSLFLKLLLLELVSGGVG